jgi:hypothetical protein
MMRDRPVPAAVPASFRPRCARTKRVAPGALAVFAGDGSAQEVPGSCAQIALSFAAVVRTAVRAGAGREPPRGLSRLGRSHGRQPVLRPDRDPGLGLFAAGGIVLKVDRATPAARLRRRRGDLIRAVAAEPIDEPAELKTILRERRLSWRLEVERGG